MSGWKRSSRCDSSACVEMWPGHATVWVRDATGAVLVVDRDAWRDLVTSVRRGSS